MKILYLHNAEYNSNMANLIQVKAMCKAMSELNGDVTLSLQRSNKNINAPAIDEYPYSIDIRKPLINNKKIDKYINVCSVKKTIHKVNPDIIYLRNPLLLKQVKNSKKPFVIELHNNKLHQGYGWLNKYWHRFLIKMSKTSQVLRIVCISEALKNYWINRGIPSNKLIVAHDGIDQNVFHKNISKYVARRKLGLPVEKQIVTYTGRLYKNRKIENIITLADKFRKVHFLLVGGPDEQSNAYKNMAESNEIKNITFTGQIPHEQIPDYLFASDVLLGLWSSDVPTINYCSPLKVFEYMAAGRIIIAHAFPTIKEVLRHNYNALLAKPDSLEELTKRTKEALEGNYPSSIEAQARKDVFTHYTWKQRARHILSEIETKKV